MQPNPRLIFIRATDPVTETAAPEYGLYALNGHGENPVPVATLAFLRDGKELYISKMHDLVNFGTGRIPDLEKVVRDLIRGSNGAQRSILSRQKKNIYLPKFDPVNGGEIYVSVRTLYDAPKPEYHLDAGDAIPPLGGLMRTFNTQAEQLAALNFHGQFFISAHSGVLTTLTTNYAFPDVAHFLKVLGPEGISIQEYEEAVTKLFSRPDSGSHLKSPFKGFHNET